MCALTLIQILDSAGSLRTLKLATKISEKTSMIVWLKRNTVTSESTIALGYKAFALVLLTRSIDCS